MFLHRLTLGAGLITFKAMSQFAPVDYHVKSLTNNSYCDEQIRKVRREGVEQLTCREHFQAQPIPDAATSTMYRETTRNMVSSNTNPVNTGGESRPLRFEKQLDCKGFKQTDL